MMILIDFIDLSSKTRYDWKRENVKFVIKVKFEGLTYVNIYTTKTETHSRILVL
jgi:hypothetical protein